MHKLALPSVALIALTLVACHGSEDKVAVTPPTIATGFFKDSSVSGLSYVSGGQSGITGSDGSFSYEVGNTVTFSVGGVTLGESIGGTIVTPVDLVTNSSTNSPQVINIVRFLMMLDTDADPDNGIQISSAVRAVAESWGPVNFISIPDLNTALLSIISDVASVDARAATLPNAVTAQAHVESTIACLNSGIFIGSYTGNDQGRFGMRVDANNSQVTVLTYSTATPGAVVTLTGANSIHITTPAPQNVPTSFLGITPNALKRFLSGRLDQTDANINADFSEIETRYTGRFASAASVADGDFSSINAVNGSWRNAITGAQGTFSGSRTGDNPSTTYRFSANYSTLTGVPDAGLYTFDINGGVVSGIAYSLVNNTTETLSGTLTGSNLSVTTASGIAITTTTLNLAAGTVGGSSSWNDGVGNSGVFAASGCRLN